MTVPRGNIRFFCNVGRIRSSVPLRPTFANNETWYCGTAIAVPYVKLHKDFDVTGYQGTEQLFDKLEFRKLLYCTSFAQQQCNLLQHIVL